MMAAKGGVAFILLLIASVDLSHMASARIQKGDFNTGNAEGCL